MSSTPENKKETPRRDFLKKAGLIGAGIALGGWSVSSQTSSAEDKHRKEQPSGPMPMRTLDKSGVKVSVLGIGGSHIGSSGSLETAKAIIHEAIDSGVNFMDNAWEYHGGRSEEWMGKALRGKRDKVFLMTKVCAHRGDFSARLAIQQLEESLRRLQTDHLDLWQLHEVIAFDHPDKYFAPGGVIEALDKAKQQGKVRFVGFTGHKDPKIHLKMLSHKYPFDTVQLPLNCFDASFNSFEKLVLPELKKQKIAALGMKPLNGNAAPIKKGAISADEALRYAISLPVLTTICGIDSLDFLRSNIRTAQSWKQLTVSEMDSIRSKVLRYAENGQFEYYKS